MYFPTQKSSESLRPATTMPASDFDKGGHAWIAAAVLMIWFANVVDLYSKVDAFMTLGDRALASFTLQAFLCAAIPLMIAVGMCREYLSKHKEAKRIPPGLPHSHRTARRLGVVSSLPV